MLVSATLDQPSQEIVVLRNWRAGFFESARYALPQGPLTAKRADEIGVHISDELYTILLFWKGVQEELPDPQL